MKELEEGPGVASGKATGISDNLFKVSRLLVEALSKQSLMFKYSIGFKYSPTRTEAI